MPSCHGWPPPGRRARNVISNVMKGASLLDVGGMGATSIVNGVPIWRPLLPHSKEEIFDFAHRFGVPYFKDTTSLEHKGKLRNQLALLPTCMAMASSGTFLGLRQSPRSSTI